MASLELEQKIKNQLDYYFSDMNLHSDKYLRTLLENENHAITLDQLLTFKKMNQYISGDKEKLNEILKNINAELKCAQFDPSTKLICRKSDKPFVYDKHFLRNQGNNILYLSKLPKSTSLLDIHSWANTFGECCIQPIKRDVENFVLTTLVVFQQEAPVKKIIAGFHDGSIRFKKEGNTELFSCKPMFYMDYTKMKNKIYTKARRTKLFKEFEKMSIRDESEKIPPKILLGSTLLLAKRTLLFNINSKLPSSELKNILSIFEVIFVYKIIPDEGYYLLFKNRTALTTFMEKLKEKPEEISLKICSQLEQMNLSADQFELIDSSSLSDNFMKYVKRVKAFFRKQSKE